MRFALVAALTIGLAGAAVAQSPLPADPRAITPEIAARWNAALAQATGEEKAKLAAIDAQIRKEYPEIAKLFDAAK